MLSLKAGVRLGGLRPELLVALLTANEAFRAEGADCMVTSANDGVHGVQSLHYSGQAMDFRTKALPNVEAKWRVVRGVMAALGTDFDVIFEDIGTENEHMHVEWQPRR